MLKTLRITSIIAAIGAVILLLLPVVYGGRSDPAIEEYLKKAGVVEQFKQTRGQDASRTDDQVSPLVKQASDFANYLNPPAAPPREAPVRRDSHTSRDVEPLGPVSAKFKLIGTSYYAAKPEQSLALIDEPGKGLHWVKQGESVGRVIIEQITDGKITVLEGQSSSEMTVTTQEIWRDLLKNPPPETRPGVISTTLDKPALPPEIEERITEPSPSRRPRGRSRSIPPRPSSVPPSRAPVIERAEPSPEVIDKARESILERLTTDANSSRVSDEEAQRMQQLIEALKKLRQPEEEGAFGEMDSNSSESGGDSVDSNK